MYNKQVEQKQVEQDMCVINDPHGQTHSSANSDPILAWKLFCFVRFWKVGTDVQTYRQHVRK